MALDWLFRRRREPAEARDLFSNSARIPDWVTISGGQTYSATNVTLESASGIPAVGSAVRLLADTIAQLPLNVYRGLGADKRLADNTWQYRLLAELPGTGEFTPFDLFSDVVSCLETTGNAFVAKVKAAGEVIALIVIDPRRVRVVRDNGEKVFMVRGTGDRAEPGEKAYTSAEILHIRGFTLNGSDMGISPIALHRQKLGTLQAKDEFQGRYYGQGAHLGGGIEVPDQLDDEQARKILAAWKQQKAGLANAHLPLILQGGAKHFDTANNLQDSQFVEGEHLSLIEVSNIFRIPASFLGAQMGSRQQSFEQDNLRFYTLSVAPRLRRIEMAFRSDPDIFPDRNLYPLFDVRMLLRTDAKTQAEVDHLAIQDGSALVDEVRADQGKGPLPPIPADPTQTPGMVPQITPVGGAPNPSVSMADTQADPVAP